MTRNNQDPMANAPIAFSDGASVLSDLMRVALAGQGFKHLSGLSYGRTERGPLESINFGSRRGQRGEFRFDLGVGIRFEEVERLLRPDRTDELLSTVGKPLSVLKAGVPHSEWCLDGQKSPDVIALEVLADIQKYALPFLNRFGCLAAVRESLLKPDPRDWFVLDPQQRIAVLVAIDHVEGRSAEAISRLDEAIQALQDQPPKTMGTGTTSCPPRGGAMKRLELEAVRLNGASHERHRLC